MLAPLGASQHPYRPAGRDRRPPSRGAAGAPRSAAKRWGDAPASAIGFWAAAMSVQDVAQLQTSIGRLKDLSDVSAAPAALAGLAWARQRALGASHEAQTPTHAGPRTGRRLIALAWAERAACRHATARPMQPRP